VVALGVAAVVTASFLLDRATALHAVDSGVANAAAGWPVVLGAVPLAAIGRAAVWRRHAAAVGSVFLIAALLFAVYRFGASAVAFASPAPFGLSGYEFPGLGAVSVIGRIAGAAAAAVLAIGLGVVLGTPRVSRKSRTAMWVGAVGLVLIALGFVLSPEPIIAGFTSSVSSPLALPNFEAAATTLRVVGMLVCVAGAALAFQGAAERVRRASWVEVQWPIAIVGAAVVASTVFACVGYFAGVGALRVLAVLMAAAGMPVAVVLCGESLVQAVPVSEAEVPARVQSETAFETVAMRVLGVARVGASLWALAIFVSFRASFDGPLPVLLLAIAVITAGVSSASALRGPLVDWRAQSGVEIVVASALLFADGAMSQTGHLFTGESSLGGPWPTVVIAAAGASGGLVVGGAAGLVVGASRVAGVLASGTRVFAAQAQGLAGASVGLVAVGLASGALLAALREAEKRIASARAREAVARRLHDGVLQALAIVKRRSTDGELVALVDSADRDLRAFLDRGDVEGELDLEESVRRAVDECERRYGLTVPVVVDEVPRRVRDDVIVAVVGAVSEALANVSKHSGVSAATVFAGMDADGRHYVSVTDRGVGFDPASLEKGRGLSGSVDGRMREVGGSATVRPLTSGGTQVMLCLP
jgi:signal transduction histidine kinase